MNKYYMQTEAEELSKIFPECSRLKTIAENCCCASTVLWMMGIDEEKHLEIIADEMGKGLANDCTVLWDQFYKDVAGRKINIEFRNIKSLEDLKDVKGGCAVRFIQGKNQHWAGVQNCRVEYNSLKYSNCVENGKPVEARIVTFN